MTLEVENSLRDLLAERALRVAKPGESFTLSTGRQSNFYFNCKPVTLSADGASLVADAFLEKLRLMPDPVTAVGGRTLGADPIILAMMMRGLERGLRLNGFLVRDAKKAHGTKELIANAPPRGTRVVIVDDVVTTGQSTIRATTIVPRGQSASEEITFTNVKKWLDGETFPIGEAALIIEGLCVAIRTGKQALASVTQERDALREQLKGDTMSDYDQAVKAFVNEVRTEAARLIKLGVPPWDAIIQAGQRVSKRRRLAASDGDDWRDDVG